MTLTVTDIQLERILRKAVEYGEAMGREGEMIARGELPREMRRLAAIRRLGPGVYAKAVKDGDLIERKLDPDKKNSPIVVDRKQVIYVEKVLKKL